MRRKLMSDSRIEPTIPILEGIVPNGPKSRVGSLTLPWHAVRGFARLFQGGSAEISAHCRVKCQVVKQGFWDDAQRGQVLLLGFGRGIAATLDDHDTTV